MMTRNEYQEMIAEMREDQLLCWGCDDAPAFEDTRYCEDCLSDMAACGWCKQEITGKRAPSGCALCDKHHRIWQETL